MVVMVFTREKEEEFIRAHVKRQVSIRVGCSKSKSSYYYEYYEYHYVLRILLQTLLRI